MAKSKRIGKDIDSAKLRHQLEEHGNLTAEDVDAWVAFATDTDNPNHQTKRDADDWQALVEAEDCLMPQRCKECNGFLLHGKCSDYGCPQ